jgi:hypothetical protein
VALREELQKRIERKQEEIRELEVRLRESQAYLAALQDMIKIVPRDPAEAFNPDQVLRPGSAVAKARDAIKAAGRPLHITELLKALDRVVDKNNRVSLTGSLNGYAKRGEIFTRPAPNTFGLVELGSTLTMENDDEPPAGFGGFEEPRITDDDVPF